jgi:PTS system mannose-specific IIC component
MENLLGPAITLAIWSGICGLDIAGPQFMLWRPLISGSVAGLLLGDLETGLIIAGGVELTWLVLVNIGGAAPPDVTVGGIVAVAVGVFQGTQDVGLAIAAATPVALVMQQLWSIAALINTAWIHRMDAAAERGDIGAVERWHVFAGLGTWFIAYSLPVFLAVYFGIPALDSIMGSIPESIIAGLE